MSELGKIYILVHRSGTTVKVGETMRDPRDRLKDYKKRHDLDGFEFHSEYPVPLKARKEIEKLAHQTLTKKYKISGIGGAREIFSCDVETAKRAIEDAIEQSEIAQKEKRLQQERERERERKEKVEREFQTALEVCQIDALSNWEKLPLTIKKKKLLATFIAKNSFTKKEKRGFGGYLWLTFCIGLLLIGHLIFIGSLRSIFGSASTSTLWDGAGLGLIFSIVLIGISFFLLKIPRADVPDEESLSKRVGLEDEISSLKEQFLEKSEKEFREQGFKKWNKEHKAQEHSNTKVVYQKPKTTENLNKFISKTFNKIFWVTFIVAFILLMYILFPKTFASIVGF